MTPEDLRKLRALTPHSQAAFATIMGVPLRTYEDLENGRSTVRPVHESAAKWALILCATKGELKSVPDDLVVILTDALRHCQSLGIPAELT